MRVRVISVEENGPEWQQGPVVRFPIGYVEGLTTQDVRYTLDGKTHAQAVNRALWFSEPKIVAEDKPQWERMFRVGQKVMVIKSNGDVGFGIVAYEWETGVRLTDFHEFPKGSTKFFELGKEIRYN